MVDIKSKFGHTRISRDLLKEVTETIQQHPLWINETDFIREAIREKISKVTECKQEA